MSSSSSSSIYEEHFQSIRLNGSALKNIENNVRPSPPVCGSGAAPPPGPVGSGEIHRSSQRNGRSSPTRSAQGFLMRTSLQRLSQEKKAKKLRFYRNGDRFFKGLSYALSTERIRTFEALLEDLTRILVDQVNLPKGVRHIYQIKGKEKILHLEQLQEGHYYVCSSSESFVKFDYALNESPQWSLPGKNEETTSISSASTSSTSASSTTNGSFSSSSTSRLEINYSPQTPTTTGTMGSSPLISSGGGGGGVNQDSSSFDKVVGLTSREHNRDFIRPKLVTVIRNGIKPRKVVRILLNKKTAHSFDQVLNDITRAIKLDTGAVRKVFTLEGKQVSGLNDFFGQEEIFIAYGSERYSQDDFDLDSEECKLVGGGGGGTNRVGSVVKKTRRSRLISTPPITTGVKSGGTCRGSTLQRQGFLQSYQSGETASSNISLNCSSSSPKSSRKCHSSKYPQCQNGKNHLPSNISGGCPAAGSFPVPPVAGVVVPNFPPDITERYLVGELIGDGNFATVYSCKEKKSLKDFALKVIDKTKCKGKEHMIASEVAILRRVAHPNIVQLFEEFDSLTEQYMVMELVKGGDLFDSIQSASKYSELETSSLVFDLTSALSYLHSLDIVHRDIKPENLLVVEHPAAPQGGGGGGRRNSLKLGDFGLAIEARQPLYTICGTPTYVAPEILAETGYGLKVDIWAAGVITYILLCGFPPFVSHSNDQEELFEQILSGKFEFTTPYWDDISIAAKELIMGMLRVESESRFSADQVLNYPWISVKNACQNKVSPHPTTPPPPGVAASGGGASFLQEQTITKGPKPRTSNSSSSTFNKKSGVTSVATPTSTTGTSTSTTAATATALIAVTS